MGRGVVRGRMQGPHLRDSAALGASRSPRRRAEKGQHWSSSSLWAAKGRCAEGMTCGGGGGGAGGGGWRWWWWWCRFGGGAAVGVGVAGCCCLGGGGAACCEVCGRPCRRWCRWLAVRSGRWAAALGGGGAACCESAAAVVEAVSCRFGGGPAVWVDARCCCLGGGGAACYCWGTVALLSWRWYGAVAVRACDGAVFDLWLRRCLWC